MTETAVPGPAAEGTLEGETTEPNTDTTPVGDRDDADAPSTSSTLELDLQSPGQADADELPESDHDGENPRAEAIRYRRQLRAAQADLAAVTVRLQQQQQSIVDSLATARGVDPRLLSTAGHTLESLSDERGVIDPAAVVEAVAAVAREFRIAQPVKPNPQQGRPSASYGAATWAQVLRGE